MPTTFESLKFENLNTVDVTVDIEAPIGTPLVSRAVPARGAIASHFQLIDVNSLKITVTAEAGAAESKQVDFAGHQPPVFIRDIRILATIGNIATTISCQA